MKKYMVEVFIEFNDKERKSNHEVFECESYTHAKNWTGDCIRLENVNTYKVSKTGKEQRKQLKRGQYITVEKMRHWNNFHVYVWENGTDNIIEMFEDR